MTGERATDPRVLRRRAGLSRAALAELSGVSAGKLGRIERGRQKMDTGVARAVAPRIGVRARTVLYGQEEIPPLGASGSHSGSLTVDQAYRGPLGPI